MASGEAYILITIGIGGKKTKWYIAKSVASKYQAFAASLSYLFENHWNVSDKTLLAILKTVYHIATQIFIDNLP